MKNFVLKITLLVAFILCMFSCGYDNMSEPESLLTGSVQYNGKNLSLRATNGSVQLQLYQDGFALHSPITVYVNQNGEFSARLFNGTYKMVTKDGSGPWVNKRDTTIIQLNGSADVKISVTPYFLISNATASIDGNKISVKMNVQKLVSDATLSDGYIAIGKTALIDDQNAFVVHHFNGSEVVEGNNTISFDLTDSQLASLKSSPRVTVRAGVRAAEADQPIFCPLIDLKL